MRTRQLLQLALKSRYFKYKLLIVLAYLGAVVGTIWWVVQGWPKQFDNDLGADIAAVPGALEGRMLVVVTNQGAFDWTDVSFVLNNQYVFTRPKLSRGEQVSISMEQFSYTYAVPRPWGRGVWRDLSPQAQPGPEGPADLRPEKLYIKTAEGEASKTLAAPKPEQPAK